MEYGILIGAGVHLIMLAYLSNRPHPEVIRLPVNNSLLNFYVMIYFIDLYIRVCFDEIE